MRRNFPPSTSYRADLDATGVPCREASQVHDRPEFLVVVLDRGARQAELDSAADFVGGLADSRGGIFDLVHFVEDRHVEPHLRQASLRMVAAHPDFGMVRAAGLAAHALDPEVAPLHQRLDPVVDN
eukprot:scaffold319_cov244-Pinguiococcus_pyrenoidosus.AAC.31